MSYECDDVHNLKNVLNEVIILMELVEDMDTKDDKISGYDKRDYVMTKMQEKLGMLFPSYRHEIETIIETTIFFTKLGRTIMVNNTIKKCVNKNCFSW